jgi:sec-independent protein translocase protein TatB
VFNGVGWPEIAVLLVIGLFVFGPERLPKAARDAGRMLRQLRQMATGMRNDLRSEIPELADLDLRSLHPRTFVRKHLFEDDDDPLLPSYLNKRTSLDSLLLDDDPPTPSLTKDQAAVDSTVSLSKPSSLAKVTRPSVPVRPEPAEPPRAVPFDPDAT